MGYRIILVLTGGRGEWTRRFGRTVASEKSIWI